ncbi:MAG: UDP-3-O-(3-hydroxymyristoyl)glucosamine N-acyltransferase [Hyphomicrobium sp.]
MQHPGFFIKAGPFSLEKIAQAAGGELAPGTDGSRLLSGLKALSDAGPDDLTFFDNRKYLDQLAVTRAGGCLVAPQFADRTPPATHAILTKATYRGFALALQLFYPEALWSKAAGSEGKFAVDPSAKIEEGAIIESGAIIGPEASIGSGSRIAAGAVIGFRVTIGRNCYVGACASVVHALVGDGVIIHPGVRIGQDGFGFAMGRDGHIKVPQVGRVIIQNNVEIGANSAIDRGALKDTVIGEGTKIDNLVQIGHNVVMGRHCVIVGQTGIAGSAELGDFVVMGGQSGVAGHIKVGSGAQIAGSTHVIEDIAAGAVVCGTPARPFKQFARENATLTRLAAKHGRVRSEDDKA